MSNSVSLVFNLAVGICCVISEWFNHLISLDCAVQGSKRAHLLVQLPAGNCFCTPGCAFSQDYQLVSHTAAN